jgi:hypothetical protein
MTFRRRLGVSPPRDLRKDWYEAAWSFTSTAATAISIDSRNNRPHGYPAIRSWFAADSNALMESLAGYSASQAISFRFRVGQSTPSVILLLNLQLALSAQPEVGRIVRPGTPVAPPAPEELQHFMDVCNRYDYWVAPPEENAAVGISLF